MKIKIEFNGKTTKDILETQAKEITPGVTQKKKKAATSQPPLPNRPQSTKEIPTLASKNKQQYLDQLHTEIKSLLISIKDQYSPDPHTVIGSKIASLEQLMAQNGYSSSQLTSSMPILPPKPMNLRSESFDITPRSINNNNEKEDVKNVRPKPDRPIAPTKMSLSIPVKPSPPPKPVSPNSQFTSSTPNLSSVISPNITPRSSPVPPPKPPPKPENQLIIRLFFYYLFFLYFY